MISSDDQDLDDLDASWGDPETPRPANARPHKTRAERTATRKAKALARAERQRTKAAAAAQKQKPKQKKSKVNSPRSEGRAKVRGQDELSDAPRAARGSWMRMFVAVAIIVAIAAFVLFVVVR